ncbi:PLP-dependent cysteine synthase family protein [Pedobacter sp. MR2016-19]|jgi:cysteine synthase A|uniref:cysteine synthase n=1 Tax=Pedobacter alluvionis TaxID=475253 RepID=A0A497XVT5_9SPHI|nr:MULTISPECIES: PLP-dependent cysteine synthase family protein [Pedobacter]MBE5319866.1 PLP-dependent cysteine synthase family protein [Pedobacter sp. MR2016-19]QXU39942.1 PLP-dependent cysteine synthase family protein [Pedobacter sp. D749]RLJ72797.1 cysteine synthase A [Pedobacter alluvionis]TFB29362.1 PLP-dependent cysteine synthase family protein [Pedobacter alluvionis]
MRTLTANEMTASNIGKFEHLSLLVGNTPMLELTYTYQGSIGKIYVKCEHYNLTGSIKDRMALYTLKKAYAEGKIKAGDRIVEATSGNTGIAFAAIGKALGHPVTIIMPNWLSKERMDIIKSLGAEIILVSKEEGGFIGSIKLAEEMAENNPDIFLPKQFENIANPEAHEHTTGKEIWGQLKLKNLSPDAFVAGVGTGGTIMGVGNFLRKQNADIKVHPLEPAESPTLTTGYKVGSHRIQGISDEFIPEIVKLSELDEVIQVNDGDAILMAQKLAEKLGLAVGISSGANVIGAIKQQQKMGIDSCVVTIFSDSNKKYLSTDLMKLEPVKTGYITPEVDFLDYQAFSRLH